MSAPQNESDTNTQQIGSHMRTRRSHTRSSARRVAAITVAGVLALSAAACSSSSENPKETATPSATEQGTVTVLAAASLRDVFTGLAADFEAEHDGVKVTLSFAGSSDLAEQILAGAPADVFASADTKNMDKVVSAGDATDPTNFAANTLTIVVPAGNPAQVTSLADLAKTDTDVVVCAAEVPCGSVTNQVAEKAGVTIHRVSEESSVTDVLTKVTAGEADAGLVYVTDATSAGDKVETIEIPAAAQVTTTYPIVVLKEAPEPELAAQWVDFVTGPVGQKTLQAAGFGKP